MNNDRCKFANGGARCVSHCGDVVCASTEPPREASLQIAASTAGLKYTKLEVTHPRLGVEIRILVGCSTHLDVGAWMDWLEERYAQWGGGLAVKMRSAPGHHTLEFHRGF